VPTVWKGKRNDPAYYRSLRELVGKEYKERHDDVAKVIHGLLAERSLQKEREPYYIYQPNRVIETQEVLLYWDRTIYTAKTVTNNRPDITVKDKRTVTNNKPDITVKDKRKKHVYLIDIAVPNNNNLINKACHKIDKYVDLRMEIERQWNVQTKVLPIVVSSTGVVPQSTVDAVNELGGGIGEIRAM